MRWRMTHRPGAGRRTVRTFGRATSPAVVQALEPRRLLSAGDLDPSFSGDGKAVIDLAGSSTEVANAVAVDPGGTGAGRVILAGRLAGPAGNGTDFAVACLNPDGSLDTTFGGGDGVTTIDFGFNNDEALDVAIDGGDRIVVVGTTNAGAGSNARNFAVARLTPNGTPDGTFSGDGKLTIDFGSNDDATSVALHGSLIYVGGYKDLGATGQFALARLTAAGQPDNTFSGDGEVFFGFGANNDSRCYDVAVQPDGKIVMAGYDENLSAAGSTRDLAVARVGTDALLDDTFAGGDGLFTTTVGLDEELRAVGVDFRGRIVAGGFNQPASGGEDFTAIRLTPAGVLDNSFNGDGKFALNLGNVDRVEDLALHPDGTVTLSGNTLGNGFQAAVAQIEPFTGTLNDAFGDGGDGIQLVDFGNIDQGFAVALDPDLRPVIAGTDGSGKLAVGRLTDLVDRNFEAPGASKSAPYDQIIPLPDGRLLALVGVSIRRLLPDGSFDPSFTTSLTTGISRPDLAVDNQGRILAGGTDTSPGADRFRGIVRRYRANGGVDTAFGGGDGEMTFSFTSPDRESNVNAIAVDASNRIIAVGSVDVAGDPDDTAVARITAGGILDGSFAGGDGVNVLPLSPGNFDEALDVAIQPWDGRIVVVGSAEFDAYALRLDTGGDRDLSFSGNGVQEFDISFGENAIAQALVFDADRRIVIGGYGNEGVLRADNFGFVARIEPDGDMDNTFSGDGRLPLKFSPLGEEVLGIDLDSVGNIVTVGKVTFPDLPGGDDDDRLIVRKLRPDGAAGVADFSGDGAWVPPLQGDTVIPLGPMPVFARSGAIYVGGGERLLRLNVDPVVVDFEFRFQTAPQTLRVQFNDDVGDTLFGGPIPEVHLQITNTTTDTQLPISAYDVTSYDRLTNTAVVTFNAPVADGNYTVNFAPTIENRQEMSLRGDRTHDFFFLRGDANRDRRVNLADFGILRQNFGLTAGGTFGRADFNYDGRVNLADFGILRGNFGRTLLASSPTS